MPTSSIPASVLLVDDQPANLLAMEAVLDSLAINLVRAESGPRALEELERQDFAAVLLDVRMPGMDGFEVARLIRAGTRNSGTPILFVTAGDDADEAMLSAYHLGAVDFLAKPLRAEVLQAKVGVFVELYRSREELRAQRDERLRLATEASGVGVWMWQPDIDRLVWEHAWIWDMVGAPRGSPAPGSAAFRDEFVHPDDRAAFQSALEGALAGDQPLFFQGRIHRRSDGQLRWLELRGRLQPARGQRPRQVLGTIADITEPKLAQERLRISEERYRTLFEAMDEGFCLIQVLRDAQGRPIDYRFLEANAAFTVHTGLADPIGRTALELVPGLDPHWLSIYDRVARTGEAERFVEEARAMHRWFDVYANRLGGAGSDNVAVLFSDITARLRSEQELRRLADELAEANRRKTEFLATLAHELRNPLAPLSNGLQLMKLALREPQMLEKTRTMMERQVQHMVHLVDDLLDVARISTGKVELRRQRIDLKTAVAAAVEISASLLEGAGHELSIELPDEPLPLEADATRLTQVVSNLLNNAAKYTPAGGAIRLSARRDGDAVQLAVTDNGIGLAPDALAKVFEMFTQVPGPDGRPQGGLGIGLSLVRSLVMLHGGTVSASSPGPGQGSTFTVRLPLAAAAPADRDDAAVGKENPSMEKLNVLVVDDNVDAAESLGLLLEMEGHTTHLAHDGKQALALAPRIKPDIIFLDIGLPDLSGYDVARQLRADPGLQRTMLVALTGWGTQDDRRRSDEAGFDRHLTKPAELPAVEKLLQAASDRRSAGE